MANVDRQDDVFQWKRPLELFETESVVKICAPMVRYSKLPFRQLVRKYGCDLAFTPMIIASSFTQSLRARDSDFAVCKEDRPLVVQFASHDAVELADAAEIVAPYADGVDLNCGCPQRWAMAEGYGACLIKKPELVSDMVRQTINRVSDNFTTSIKIRIHDDPRETVKLCRQAEAAGVAWISVHGRTKEQRNHPVNMEALKLIRENVDVPVIANGDVKSLEDAEEVVKVTGVKGVMAARGILANPAMYAGFDITPEECVREWIKISQELGTAFTIFHHHLIYMLERVMSKAERRIFNTLTSTVAVLDYLRENYDLG